MTQPTCTDPSSSASRAQHSSLSPQNASLPKISSSQTPSSLLQSQIESDPEVMIVTNLRLALSSMLHMLERVKDDLIVLGNQMDRLTESSQRYREFLIKKNQPMISTNVPVAPNELNASNMSIISTAEISAPSSISHSSATKD